MATYRMCEPPLPREQAARRRLGLIAITLAAATMAIGYDAPDAWRGAAAATGVLCLLFGAAYLRYAKIRGRSAYTLDDTGVRKEPAGAGVTSLAWDEITGFAEQNGGLVLLTADRLRRLAIPAGLEGIERLRAELVKCRLVLADDTEQHRNRWEGALWTALVAAGLGGLVLSRTRSEFLLAVAAGAAVMVVLQWRAVRVSRRRWAGWDELLAWIVFVAEGYNHHFHGQAPRLLPALIVLATAAPAVALVIRKGRRRNEAAAATTGGGAGLEG